MSQKSTAIRTGPKSEWPAQAQEIIASGYPAAEPLLPGLVAWLQDINWPGAREITNFLLEIGEPVVPHVKELLRGRDRLWQFFVLNELVDRWPRKWVAELTPELMQLIWVSDGDEADIAALRQLAKHQLGERDKIEQAIGRKRGGYKDLLAELREIEQLLTMSDTYDDRQQLLHLHQVTLDAHLASDAELLLRDEGDVYVVVNRGEITHPDKAQRRARFASYLAATTFEVYRDEVAPLVTVSEDGTLGWVVVQVYARGKQAMAEGDVRPLEFTSAWLELYQKINGRWQRIGNVSNFKS